MAIEIIDGETQLGVVAGSLDGREWIIGTTPVTEILHVDEKDHRAELIGVKYSSHRPFDPPKGERKPDPYTRITMLVAGGPWEQRMWNDSGKSLTVRLNSPGDYIAWLPGPWHSWTPIGNTTMLTVTYKNITTQAASSNA